MKQFLKKQKRPQQPAIFIPSGNMRLALPGRLGHLKKFSPLQECDDWLSADPTKREFRPSKSDNDRLVAVLDFLPAVVALGDNHGRWELCGCVLNLYNAGTKVS